MDDCIFCKIVKGDIPSYKILESEFSLAFLDACPVNKGHALVIPKDHFLNTMETPDSILQDMIVLIKKISQGIERGLDVKGINIFQRNGEVAGQEVKHLHFHVLPRVDNDGLKIWAGKNQYTDGEAIEYQNKIKDSIL